MSPGSSSSSTPTAASAPGPPPPSTGSTETAPHVRGRDGRWDRGGAAVIRIAAFVPLLRPLAVAGRLPLVRWAFEAWYRGIARNRHGLGRLLGLESCTYRGR
ncbi:MAG: DUF393 domain-containing protein [Chloroflexi bacterium]|nr:DUF393 domain-containing protein [Chloroflexota bacterium]